MKYKFCDLTHKTVRLYAVAEVCLSIIQVHSHSFYGILPMLHPYLLKDPDLVQF